MCRIDDDEWQWTNLVKEYKSSSLDGLEKEEIERLTIAAIHEHRRRLDVAQSLHEEVERLGESASSTLRSDYSQAVDANDAHQMVVQMLLDVLGYMPALDQDAPLHS